MKFETVRIHFLSDVSRNFATMATWRNIANELHVNLFAARFIVP